MIYGMPGVGKSEFAQYAAHRFVAEFSRYARRAGLEMLPRQVELHGLEGVARTGDELGEIHATNGDRKAAADTWSRALEIARDHGVRREVDKLEAKLGRVR